MDNFLVATFHVIYTNLEGKAFEEGDANTCGSNYDDLFRKQVQAVHKGARPNKGAADRVLTHTRSGWKRDSSQAGAKS
jgi:hypothetical protein